MFASKTDRLLKRVERADRRGHTTALVRFTADTRYTHEAKIVSHSGRTADATVLDELLPVIDQLRAFQVVGIDEIHFFPDAVDAVKALLRAGVHVVCSGLAGKANKDSWPVIADLLPYASDIKFSTAVCATPGCGRDAPFTRLHDQDQDLAQPVIGGTEKYAACCERCHPI